MHRYFLGIRAFLLIGVVVATGSLAAGCGGGSGIEVETGDLTKAEFIKRANGVCGAIRLQFARDFSNYYRDHSPKQVGSEEKWAEEVVDRAVVPNYEVRLIDRFSTLGVPSAEKDEVVAFLEAVQQQVDKMQENANELTKSPFPFAKPAKLARKQGLTRCADAFG